MADAGFSNIPRKYENVVFIIKNPRNRMFSKVTLVSWKIKKYYVRSTTDDRCVKKLDDYRL